MTRFEELCSKFDVQDCGAYCKVFTGGVHIKVAIWVEGPDVWSMTPEGEALLAPPEVVESVDTSASKPKKQKAKAAEEPNLDDL